MTLRAVCLYILMGKLNKFITERKLQPRLIELRIADKVIVKQGSARIHTERNENLFLANIKDFIFHTWLKGNDGYLFSKYLFSNQYFFRIHDYEGKAFDILE